MAKYTVFLLFAVLSALILIADSASVEENTAEELQDGPLGTSCNIPFVGPAVCNAHCKRIGKKGGRCNSKHVCVCY